MTTNGVTNDIDLCARHPWDAEVDGNGCAASHWMTINDGVLNDLDLCADTPVELKVDGKWNVPLPIG